MLPFQREIRIYSLLAFPHVLASLITQLAKNPPPGAGDLSDFWVVKIPWRKDRHLVLK